MVAFVGLSRRRGGFNSRMLRSRFSGRLTTEPEQEKGVWKEAASSTGGARDPHWIVVYLWRTLELITLPLSERWQERPPEEKGSTPSQSNLVDTKPEGIFPSLRH